MFNGYVDSNRNVSDEDIEVARATWITLLQLYMKFIDDIQTIK